MTRDIKDLRKEISSLDKDLITLLSRRMQLSLEVADYKIANQLPIFDPIREKEILKQYSRMVDFDIYGIYEAIMTESKRLQWEKFKK